MAHESAPKDDANTPISEDKDLVDSIARKDDVNSEQGSKQEEDEPAGGFGNYLRIFHYADPLSRVLFAGAMLGSLASGSALPLMTLVFGKFTNEFSSLSVGAADRDRFTSAVNDLLLYFVYLFVGRFVIVYAANLAISVAAIRTTAAIRRAFIEATLRQEVWHFDKASNGSAATQVTTNGNRINQGLADKLATIVSGLGLFFSSFIIAIAVQWKLALIVASIIPAIFVSTGGCIAADAPVEANIIRIYSRAAVQAQEAISSIKTVHAFWAQEKLAARYNEFLRQAWKVGQKKSPIYGILFSTEYFLVLCGTALAFWQGFRMFQSGEIPNVGTVFTVVLSITIGATAMSLIGPQIQSITNASSAAAELFSIIDKKSELDPLSSEGEQPETCAGDIQVRNLCFSYPSRPQAQVLHSLDLSIPAGKTTALVGASGCGKSTLVGLLERWYVPTSGHILLDGKELGDYNTAWLRRKIRLVQQEPVLFRGTVFENVAKGFVGVQMELSHEEQMKLVEEACRSANAHDFITDLPEGYHTQVGERASMLSGGQKQRVAIARSIISDPQILLLDEATSALDPRAEKLVQDALDRVSVNKTTLIIAHKLATVKKADNIVVMSHGKVLEQGTHRELIEKDGSYASLVRAQDLGDAQGDADFTKEQEDLALERSRTLQRTKSEARSVADDEEAQNLTRGTLNLSLLRCIFIMLWEQKDLYWWFTLSTFGSLIGGGTYPAQAILYSKVITVFTLQGQEAREQADLYSLLFFVLALANLFAYFAIGWGCNVISQTVTARYRLEMFRRILNLDADFFDRPENSSGALTSKLSSLPTALQELVSANVLLIFIVIVNLISSSVLAIAYGWKLGLVVVFGGLPLLVGAGIVKIRLEQKNENSIGKPFAESAALATEAVTSIRTISSLTLESRILDEYNATLDGIVKRSSRSLLFTMFWYALSQSIEFLIMALGFWYGSKLLVSGEYTTEQFFVIYVAVIFGGQAAGQFFGYSTSITKARPAANYILWLRTLKIKIAETSENKEIGPPSNDDGKDGALGVEDVEFRYAQRDASRVLRGITMDIAPGSYAACVGPSGCGKSTLISLLERFYDPTSGRITINRADIKAMSPRNWRAYMSLVQQEPTLYQGSVKDNVALGLDYEPSEAEINEACRQANALEFIQSLPEGLGTPCGSRGLSFSGGQRQRIAIARALIRKPRLLLLDEATSALDTESERIVQKALDEAATTRTTVAVAHRLSTIKHADIIFVFAGGKIAEMGTHEELLAQKGRYYEMARAQSLDRA
jgi:ATP-binding cassette, subfamily B (MDR/TAP), member 1